MLENQNATSSLTLEKPFTIKIFLKAIYKTIKN